MIAQNKIFGKAFADVPVYGDSYDGSPYYEPLKILWRLNVSTLDEMGIKDDFIKDFIDQITAMGTIADLRRKLHLEPRSGARDAGIVLQHKQMPWLRASVTVYSDAGYLSPQEIPYDYDDHQSQEPTPHDLLLRCYADADHIGPEDYRGIENEMSLFNALAHGGWNRYSEEGKIEGDSGE